MTPYWRRYCAEDLAQGDLLPDCLTPEFDEGYGDFDDQSHPITLVAKSLIVVTQTCDIVNSKAPFIALCPIYTIPELVGVAPQFRKNDALDEIRKGRREALHMLASPESPQDNLKALIVDFRLIHSLPIEYLQSHAHGVGDRWRLDSPFLEHFSQAFARFFMRVGLPSQIPTFR